jgi:hypothetical protein
MQFTDIGAVRREGKPPARDMEDVSLRRLVECPIRDETQALYVAHRFGGPGVKAMRRIRQAGEHLDRPGQINLVDAVEQQRSAREMRVVVNYTIPPKTGIAAQNATGPTAPHQCLTLAGSFSSM